MLYEKPLASHWSPTALKRPDRSKQCHCLQFAKNKGALQFHLLLQIRLFSSEDILCIEGEKGCIGDGTYGSVKLGKNKIHGWIAIKCMSIDGDYRQKQRTKLK